MTGRVEFYQLTHKFVNQDQDIPEGSRQVIYYSLAIGHHVGVMDCFQKRLDIPLEEYSAWLAGVPNGSAHHKLEGVLKWGEIEINQSHARDLLPILKALQHGENSGDRPWVESLIGCLRQMIDEPALYVMIRKVA